MTDLGALGLAHLLDGSRADVGRERERNRQRRLGWFAGGLAVLLFVLIGALVPASPYHLSWPKDCAVQRVELLRAR